MTVEPTGTERPGAVGSLWPLTSLTRVMAGAEPKKSAVSVALSGVADGRAGVVDRLAGGRGDVLELSGRRVPAAAVQVSEPPGASEVSGQVIAPSTLSVNATASRVSLPVLVTT